MENIFRGILSGKVKTVESPTTLCNCTHCKKEINSNHTYLQFTGEHLHTDCLIEYLQKMRLLKIIEPQKSGDEN